jgi:hypothetical protein
MADAMSLPFRVPPSFTVLLILAGRLLAGAAEPAVVASGANAPGMKAIVYGFFDDKTGDRIGRLQIDKVGVEYQHRGFLKVAWDPLVVLDGVTLEISGGAAWPEAGVKIIDALRVTGRQSASVLRNVHLRLPGAPGREIAAASATLRQDGGLELLGVNVPAGATPAAPPSGTGNLCFWLTGPHAGQLTPAASPASPAVAQTTLAN